MKTIEILQNQVLNSLDFLVVFFSTFISLIIIHILIIVFRHYFLRNK